jgi:hypothetical protein
MYDHGAVMVIGKHKGCCGLFECAARRDCGLGLRYENIREWRGRERAST